MKRIFLLLSIIVLPFMKMNSEQISQVDTSGSWIYLYNSQGRKYKTLSVSTVGTVLGYSANFFVSCNGNWIYVWDTDGKKICTKSVSTIGEVTGVAGDTFTSRNGNWIYTWNREGRKINTRPAK